MHSESNLQKQSLRELLTQHREQFADDDRKNANKIITSRVLENSDVKKAKIISVYVSLPEEVDTSLLIHELWNQNKEIVVPRMESNNLSLHTFSSYNQLQKGRFNVLEPSDLCPRIDPDCVDAFIIPGVGFDRQGNRLGWGKGYYDRLLKPIHVPKIGIAFSYQIFPLVPHESYDIVMNAIITEKETIII